MRPTRASGWPGFPATNLRPAGLCSPVLRVLCGYAAGAARTALALAPVSRESGVRPTIFVMSRKWYVVLIGWRLRLTINGDAASPRIVATRSRGRIPSRPRCHEDSGDPQDSRSQGCPLGKEPTAEGEKSDGCANPESGKRLAQLSGEAHQGVRVNDASHSRSSGVRYRASAISS
jgi:hypothetical protein